MEGDDRTRRLKPGDWRLWLGVLFFAYVVFGFFGVPSLVKWQVVKQCRELLGREATVGEVRSNPFTLALVVKNFELRDPDGEVLVSMEDLVVDASVSSLFRWAAVLDELRVDGPRVRVRMLQDGSLSIRDLLERRRAVREEKGPPRFSIAHLAVGAGVFEFLDLTRSPAYDLRFDDLSLTLRHVSTIDEDAGAHEVAIRFGQGAELEWSGSMLTSPLVLDGRFELRGLSVPGVWEYLGSEQPFDLTDGRVDAAVSYHVSMEDEGIRAELSSGSARLSGLTLQDRESAETWLTVPSVDVGGVSARWPDREVAVESVVVESARLEAFFDEDGKLNWKRLLPVPEDGAAPAPAVRLALSSLEIRQSAVGLSDLRRTPPATAAISDASLTVRSFTYPEEAPAEVKLEAKVAESGVIRAEGTVSIERRSADLGVEASEIPVVEHLSWIPRIPFGRVVSGRVGAKGTVRLGERPRIEFRGEALLTDAEVVNREDERLLAAAEVKAEGIAATIDPIDVRVRSVSVRDPFAKIRIDSEGVLNLEREVFAAIEREEKALEPAAQFPFTVGEVNVEGGEVDFADFSLIIPFAARVTDGKGTIREISSSSMSGSGVEIEGSVEESGFARVEGTLRPFDPFAATELRVIFRNVDMTTLTPYSAEFAGYAIEDGRLDLDVRYAIRDRLLRGDHNVLARDLVLGERVEGAKGVPLPLKLAVALLKDKDGRIDLDVPMEGSIDDPEFNYRRVAWAALKQILVNVATKPFAFIGDVLGISGDELERVAFEAGGARLLPPEQEQLTALVAELVGREEIRVEITPVFDRLSDAGALREAKLKAVIDARRNELGDGPTMDQVLEGLFTELRGTEAVEELRARHTRKDGDAEPVFDGAGFYAEIRAALLAAQSVEVAELEDLASKRGAAIVAALTGESGVDTGRVTVLAPSETDRKDGGAELVPSRLTLSAD